MNCEKCSIEMKQLFTTLYCPNECDKTSEDRQNKTNENGSMDRIS